MLEPAGETLLYYAAGGGLGHITRALAILQALPQGSFPARVLCSSRLSPLVREAAGPLPLDCPPEEILSSRRAYYRYLRDYLALYRVGILVLDCFPWGLIGEWAELGEHIPRLLIARSLKWGAYRERLDSREGPPPRASLVLEPLEEEYHRLLKGWGDTALLADPVLPADFDVSETSPPSFKENRLLLVHSGSREEQHQLRDFAQQQAAERGLRDPLLDTVFPDRNLFPAHPLYREYRYIAAGGGYNMAAASSRALPGQSFFLHPFPRRFDDQQARVDNLARGLWQDGRGNGREAAARWIFNCIKNLDRIPAPYYP